MDAYRFVTHAEIDDKAWLQQALSDLNAVTFGHYDGVCVPSPSFMAWYTGRPGMDPRLCQAVVAGRGLVSSLFVTVTRMRLGGGWVLCGIVDTVMTHPGHRRRGLARALLERAIAGLEEAGVEISFLNTAEADPPGVPQKLYGDLGYVACERVDRFVRQPPQNVAGTPAAAMPPDETARQAFSSALGERSGWLELDERLWRWRRRERPPQYPVTVRKTADGGLGVICVGELMLERRPQPFNVLSDFVPSAECSADGVLRSMLAAGPRDAPVLALCPRSDEVLLDALRATGFEGAGTEVAMVRPIAPSAGRLVEHPPESWYVAVESVVGV